MAKDSQILMV